AVDEAVALALATVGVASQAIRVLGVLSDRVSAPTDPIFPRSGDHRIDLWDWSSCWPRSARRSPTSKTTSSGNL
ncbi:MAG: hypothetical protein MJA29_01750, partial [Candidatus Omnitrophica bacterium]|nr:hypothetical protein [Candidatus Omnitrophota bacterium]